MKKRKPRVWLRCVLAAMSMGILFVGAWMVLDQPSRLFGENATQDEDALNVVGVRSYDWLRIMGAAGGGNATYQINPIPMRTNIDASCLLAEPITRPHSPVRSEFPCRIFASSLLCSAK